MLTLFFSIILTVFVLKKMNELNKHENNIFFHTILFLVIPKPLIIGAYSTEKLK